MRRVILHDNQSCLVGLNLVPFSIRITCCDCGLAHDIMILKYDDLHENDVEMIFKRNNRATAQYRRHLTNKT